MIRIVWSLYKKKDQVLVQLHSSIASVLENTSEDVEIHILCDENLTETDRKDIRFLVEEKYKQQVWFHDIVFDFSKVNFPMSHTQGAYYRLFISEFIERTGKLIYLDYDVYVHLNIKELWDIDLEDNSIGVVIDSIALESNPPANIKKYFDDREINIKKYFNSGVMLIDMEKWDSVEVVENAKNYFEKYPYCRFVDQDFLNFYFNGKTKFLPSKFNIMNIHSTNVDDESMNGIYHFCGLPKPWEVYRGGVDRLFWQYLSKTKYGYYGSDMINYIPIMNWPVDKCIENGMPLGSRKKMIIAVLNDTKEKIRRRFSNKPFDIR